jgi:hypothetical protein
MVLSGIAFAVASSFTWLYCVATNSSIIDLFRFMMMDDGYKDTLGFVTVFSVLAQAAAVTWHGSDALPPIQYDRAFLNSSQFLCAEIAHAAAATWHGSDVLPPSHFCFVFFFSFFSIFQVHNAGADGTLGIITVLSMRILQQPIMIEREWIVLNEMTKEKEKKEMLKLNTVQQPSKKARNSQRRSGKMQVKKKKKKKNYSTEYSHVVPHHSTDSAINCLTAQIGRDAVGLVVYGRNSKV